jgi:hypothetical protein
MLGARAGRPHWLITRYDHSKMSVLTIHLSGDGEALVVFGFKEEAEMFLHFRGAALEDGWRVRQTSVGELMSVLYGPCSNAKKIVLDPLPEVGKRELVGSLSVHRNDFLWGLLGEGPSSRPLVLSRTPRPFIRLEHGGIA